MAQAQTQLTLFVDPQSLSLECEHGSGAEGSKCSLDQGPSPNAGQCRQAASRRRCESDPQSYKETTSMLTKKLSEKLMAEEMDEMIQIVEVAHSVPRIRGTNRRADCGTDMSQGADS